MVGEVWVTGTLWFTGAHPMLGILPLFAMVAFGQVTPAPQVAAEAQVSAQAKGVRQAEEIRQAEEVRQVEDPYLWLEDVGGSKALDWARAQNKKSLTKLENLADYKPIHDSILKILDSKDRIPYVSMRKEHLYNFWQDAAHVRGILRRTTLDEYKKKNPQWETVLDVDALAAAENENWVYKGSFFLYPTYDRCMVSLSRGGADATVQREFDVITKSFVKDGFVLPEAKSSISWIDRDHLYVGTDFGDGSLTDSGYPRTARLWTRGTALKDAPQIFEGVKTDVSAGVYTSHTPEGSFDFASRTITFYTSELYYLLDGRKIKIDIPEDANFQGIFKKQMLVRLKSDWTVGGKTYPVGGLIAIDFEKFLAGDRGFETLFTPSERVSLSSVTMIKNRILVNTLDNVASVLHAYSFENGHWKHHSTEAPSLGSIYTFGSRDSDTYFVNYTGYLHPSTLYLADAGVARMTKIKELPHYFDATPYLVKRHEARSKDGTMVPYFVVRSKTLKYDSSNPTILYGYGGFQVSLAPRYSGSIGAGWLEHGGVYVVANIRGGGEFGPKWHQAALKKNRHKAYEDFIAVAEDLVAKKITSPRHLGIRGGSNGGLLVGAVFTQRPELFNAVVCSVPLLDMQRYHKLLAGASWMGEYGNPDDPDMWDYIRTYSPYHNVHSDRRYPKVFFHTSTRDDRVHPGHARKMVAKMMGMGHPVYYYENIEGGHGGAANNRQRAHVSALAYAYLLDQLR